MRDYSLLISLLTIPGVLRIIVKFFLWLWLISVLFALGYETFENGQDAFTLLSIVALSVFLSVTLIQTLKKTRLFKLNKKARLFDFSFRKGKIIFSRNKKRIKPYLWNWRMWLICLAVGFFTGAGFYTILELQGGVTGGDCRTEIQKPEQYLCPNDLEIPENLKAPEGPCWVWPEGGEPTTCDPNIPNEIKKHCHLAQAYICDMSDTIGLFTQKELAAYAFALLASITSLLLLRPKRIGAKLVDRALQRIEKQLQKLKGLHKQAVQAVIQAKLEVEQIDVPLLMRDVNKYGDRLFSKNLLILLKEERWDEYKTEIRRVMDDVHIAKEFAIKQQDRFHSKVIEEYRSYRKKRK